MPPEDYLRASYYEKWLWRLEKLLADAGMVTREEIERRNVEMKQAAGMS